MLGPTRNALGIILAGGILATMGTAEAAKTELIVGNYHCVQTLADGGSIRTEVVVRGTRGILGDNGLALRDVTTEIETQSGCPEVTASFIKRASGLGCTASPVRLAIGPPDQPERGTYSFAFSCEDRRNGLVRTLGELTREFLTALSF